MNILSLYLALPCSVALYQDGRVVAAAQEERFSRIKNDERFPIEAIDYCLSQAGLAPSDLDAVALASFRSASFDDTVTRKSQWTVDDYLREQYERWYPIALNRKEDSKSLVEIFPEKIDLDLYPQAEFRSWLHRSDRNKLLNRGRISLVSEYLSVAKEKIFRIEHHRCHAAYSYYASPFRGEDILALTIDGSGDGLNATIGIFDSGGQYVRHFKTADCNIGRIYRYMTLLLGMKPNEHEYKLMGLAPYGREKHAQKALDVFESTLYVDGIDFKWKVKPSDSYFWFKERLEGVRFDHIAYALQTWVEGLLTQWVKNAIQHFGINKLVISGGVAMNIKAMGKVAALPEVEDLFIAGSSGDESMAVSAGVCLAEDLAKENNSNWDAKHLAPVPSLYLGPQARHEQERHAIEELDQNQYEITTKPDVGVIAEILAEGKVLARCAGRMEFGQRALGNRSILADPGDPLVKDQINAAIKSRDFWMPFAPIVLDTYVDRYIVNPKQIESPHMTIGFETTPEGYSAMIAACHPADKTVRAQILKREDNPSVYSVLEAFEKVTGRGALLNTSFNLHGEPIVNTPEDAVRVLINSRLDGLILQDYLVLKKS